MSLNGTLIINSATDLGAESALLHVYCLSILFELVFKQFQAKLSAHKYFCTVLLFDSQSHNSHGRISC